MRQLRTMRQRMSDRCADDQVGGRSGLEFACGSREEGDRADCAGRARWSGRVLRHETWRDYHRTNCRSSQASRLRSDLRHIVRSRSYCHRRRHGVPGAESAWRNAADVHLLLPRLGEVCGAVFSGTAPESFYVPLAAGDVRLAREGHASRSTQDRAQEPEVVAIMPCTAKKFEAQRPEMGVDGDPDVDYVLTTQELAQMIQSAGIMFDTLQPESFDMPFG